MIAKQALVSFAAGMGLLLAFMNASGFDLNKSVEVEAGSESDGESTVNGSISVGTEAVVNGSLDTVNGTIRVEEKARIQKAQTVNGSVRIADGVTAGSVGSVNGTVTVGENVELSDISVVNGRISLAAGSRVRSDVGNVNGEIDIEGAEIGGDLSTVNGDVTLADEAVLKGDLTVEKPDGFDGGQDRRKPRIVLGPGVRVEGALVLEREVELFISDSAEVGSVEGVMSIDDAVRFSGDRP
jgi:cytoskeletal protein CcmA (bactofilin family)